MPSALSWLDASAEDQRRMREIVGLFSNTDSRDELGIGQIRDVLSDALFPGTSVLITRARYLLFVPWCFQKAAAGRRPGADARRDRYERDLIDTLRKSDDVEGLLGSRAGRALTNLPSVVYWNPLRRWGILADPSLSWDDALGGVEEAQEQDEGDPQPLSPWSSSMPAMPPDFPAQAPVGFELTADESQWLVGRILTTCGGTLLAHLAEHRPERTAPFPWDDPAAQSADPAVRAVLEHARVFSQLVHGAALLYNLLLAEAYGQTASERLGDLTQRYRDELTAWEGARDRDAAALERWSFDDLRAYVQQRSPTVSRTTWAFLSAWSEIAGPGKTGLADSPGAREFIAARERQHKRGQSRFANSGLLRSWSGAAGSGRLAFRWASVRRILLDIHDGLDRDDA